MKIIDLINEIHKNKIADGTKFYIYYRNGMRRGCYYNKNGEDGFIYQLSDNAPCQDFISFEDRVEFIEDVEKPKKIEKVKELDWYEVNGIGDEDDAFYLRVNDKEHYLDSEYDSTEVTIVVKINEIIENLNYLLEKSDKE